METAVQVRIIDQTFPADGGAGFFEIDPHDDLKIIGEMTAKLCKLFRIFFSCSRVMNGAGSDDDKQTVILSVNDIVCGVTCDVHGRGSELSAGEFANEVRRRCQFSNFFDSEVVGCVRHFVSPLWRPSGLRL